MSIPKCWVDVDWRKVQKEYTNSSVRKGALKTVFAERS